MHRGAKRTCGSRSADRTCAATDSVATLPTGPNDEDPGRPDSPHGVEVMHGTPFAFPAGEIGLRADVRPVLSTGPQQQSAPRHRRAAFAVRGMSAESSRSACVIDDAASGLPASKSKCAAATSTSHVRSLRRFFLRGSEFTPGGFLAGGRISWLMFDHRTEAVKRAAFLVEARFGAGAGQGDHPPRLAGFLMPITVSPTRYSLPYPIWSGRSSVRGVASNLTWARGREHARWRSWPGDSPDTRG